MLMFGIVRDGELLEAFVSAEKTNRMIENYRPGSKHQWDIVRVEVSPIQTPVAIISAANP